MTEENDDTLSPREKRQAAKEARFAALYAIELEYARKHHPVAFDSNDPEVLREIAIRQRVENWLPPGVIIGPDGDEEPSMWDALLQLTAMLAPIQDAMCAKNTKKLFTPAAATGIYYTLSHVSESVRRLWDWVSYCNDRVNEVAQKEHTEKVGEELAAARKEQEGLKVQAIQETAALWHLLNDRPAVERKLLADVIYGLKDEAVRDRVRTALNGHASN